MCVYQLPQLLVALGDWLRAGAAADRLADVRRRPPTDLAALICTAFDYAGDQASVLARALSAAHNLAATLHAADPVGPAAAGRVIGHAVPDDRRGPTS
jgi:hypothetical protein